MIVGSGPRCAARELGTLEALALDALPVGVVVADARGAALRWNSAAERLLGGPPGPELAGADLWRPGAAAPARPAELPLARALATGEPVADDRLIVRHPDGQERVVLASAVPLRDGAGRLVGAAATFADVTGLYELDLERDEFLDVVVHDLRSPLTAVRGYAQLLLTRAGAERRRQGDVQMLESLIAQVDRVILLTRRVLETLGLDLGRLSLRREPVDLAALVRDVAERLAPAGSAPLVVVEAAPGVLGHWDRQVLEAAMGELLDTALRRLGGELRLRVWQEAGEARVAVAGGAALAPAELAALLEQSRFRVPGVSGTGRQPTLGLALARRLIRAHGGELAVAGEPGRGTLLLCALPLEAPAERPPAASA